MAKKCYVCNKLIQNEEEMIPYKNRFVHPDCFNIAVKIVKQEKDEELAKKTEEKKEKKKKAPRPKAELKEGLSNEEYKEKEKYYSYLKKLLNTEKLTAKIYTVSERDKDRFGWTWIGMYNTLVYLNEIKEKELIGDIVGYLPYSYDEAQAFYDDVKKVEENNKEASLSDMYQTKRIKYHKKSQQIIEDLVIESIKKSN